MMSNDEGASGDGDKDLSSVTRTLTTLDISEDGSSSEKIVKVLAWDHSGSTGGSNNYFTIGRKFLNQFRLESTPQGPNMESVYLLWDSVCECSTPEDIYQICDQQRGRGGTYPSAVINWLTKNYDAGTKIELWLITDGEIPLDELKRCSELNENMNYSKVKFIVIDNNMYGRSQSQIGLSVGASFFAGSNIEIFTNDTMQKRVDTSKPYDYDSVDVDNFDEKWNDLSDFIKFKFMGSSRQGLEEVDKLNALRRRLLNTLSSQASTLGSQESEKFPTFESNYSKPEILNKLKTCKFYKVLTSSEVKDARSKIDGSISTLINYIHNDNKRSFGFESLKMEYKQDKLMGVAEEEPKLDSLDDVQPCDFYDAVTLEDEHGTPVLLLSHTDLITKYWKDKNYSKFRTLMDCPLFASIDECIGHVYSLETFRALCSNNYDGDISYNIINPMTNQQVFGGLIFAKSADSWNDYVLSKTFFQGKKVKTCMALWYYVIWKHAKGKEWIESGVADQLKTYALRRLHEAKVPLALSTLSLDPQEIVPVHIACFFCTEGSSLLFGGHPVLFLHERLRMFHSVSQDMVDILQCLQKPMGVGVDIEFVTHRAKTFSLVNELKKIPQTVDKRLFLLKGIFETTPEGFLTYQVKNKDAIRYLNLLSFGHKSMIPFQFNEKSLVDLHSLTVLPYQYEVNLDMELSMDTFRPFFVVHDENNHQVAYYSPLMKRLRAVVLNFDGEAVVDNKPVEKLDQNRLIPYCKLYIDLTIKLKRFPTWDEYVEYALSRRKTLGSDEKIYLLPPDILKSLKFYFDLYSNLDVKVEEFIAKTNKSYSIEERVEMEGVLERSRNIKDFIKKARSVLV